MQFVKFGRRGPPPPETAIYLASASYEAMPPGNPDETDFPLTPAFDIYPTRTSFNYSNHVDTENLIYVDVNTPDVGEGSLSALVIDERAVHDSDDFSGFADKAALIADAAYSEANFGSGAVVNFNADEDRVEIERIDSNNEGRLIYTVACSPGDRFRLDWDGGGGAVGCRSWIALGHVVTSTDSGYNTTGSRSFVAAGSTVAVRFSSNGNATSHLNGFTLYKTTQFAADSFTSYADTAALLSAGYSDESSGEAEIALDADADTVLMSRDTGDNASAIERTYTVTSGRYYTVRPTFSGVSLVLTAEGVVDGGPFNAASEQEMEANSTSLVVLLTAGPAPGEGSSEVPYRALASALAEAGAKRIYMAGGRYYQDWPADYYFDNIATEAAYISIEPWPGTIGRPQVVAAPDPTGISWTDNEDGTWSATIAGAFSAADFATLDAEGMPTPLTIRASEEALGSAEEGIYISGGDVMVKPIRETIDNDLLVFVTDGVNYQLKVHRSRDIYMRGIDILGIGVLFDTVLGFTVATGLGKIDGCRFGYTFDDALSFDTYNYDGFYAVRDSIIAYAGRDGINMLRINPVSDISVLEERCVIYRPGRMGALDEPNQCSTCHEAAFCITLAARYYDSAGQVIADVGGSRRWIINSDLGPSLSQGPSLDTDGLWASGSIIWADNVRITGGNVSYTLTNGGKIYVRGGSADGSGSPTDPY